MHGSRYLSFPGASDSKDSTHIAGYLGLIPGVGRSPGREHVNALQYSCLENPHGQRSWRAAVNGVAELDMTEQISTGT